MQRSLEEHIILEGWQASDKQASSSLSFHPLLLGNCEGEQIPSPQSKVSLQLPGMIHVYLIGSRVFVGEKYSLPWSHQYQSENQKGAKSRRFIKQTTMDISMHAGVQNLVVFDPSIFVYRAQR